MEHENTVKQEGEDASKPVKMETSGATILDGSEDCAKNATGPGLVPVAVVHDKIAHEKRLTEKPEKKVTPGDRADKHSSSTKERSVSDKHKVVEKNIQEKSSKTPEKDALGHSKEKFLQSKSEKPQEVKTVAKLDIDRKHDTSHKTASPAKSSEKSGKTEKSKSTSAFVSNHKHRDAEKVNEKQKLEAVTSKGSDSSKAKYDKLNKAELSKSSKFDQKHGSQKSSKSGSSKVDSSKIDSSKPVSKNDSSKDIVKSVDKSASLRDDKDHRPAKEADSSHSGKIKSSGSNKYSSKDSSHSKESKVAGSGGLPRVPDDKKGSDHAGKAKKTSGDKSEKHKSALAALAGSKGKDVGDKHKEEGSKMSASTKHGGISHREKEKARDKSESHRLGNKSAEVRPQISAPECDRQASTNVSSGEKPSALATHLTPPADKGSNPVNTDNASTGSNSSFAVKDSIVSPVPPSNGCIAKDSHDGTDIVENILKPDVINVSDIKMDGDRLTVTSDVAACEGDNREFSKLESISSDILRNPEVHRDNTIDNSSCTFEENSRPLVKCDFSSPNCDSDSVQDSDPSVHICQVDFVEKIHMSSAISPQFPEHVIHLGHTDVFRNECTNPLPHENRVTDLQMTENVPETVSGSKRNLTQGDLDLEIPTKIAKLDEETDHLNLDKGQQLCSMGKNYMNMDTNL